MREAFVGADSIRPQAATTGKGEDFPGKDDMMKKKKKTLTGPAEREDLNLVKASCATECTGVIPIPPQNEDERENYHRVYSFSIEEE